MVDDAVLLQVSACADAAQLSALLAQTPLDPLTIVANAPECVDVNELAELLSGLVGLTGNDSSQLVEACIARAECIDQWTGRLDWAVRWLERVQAMGVYGVAADALLLDRALRNAKVLELMLERGQEAGLSLLDVNGMSQPEFVDWCMDRCCTSSELFSVPSAVAGCVEGDAELRSAWNTWWARNMLVAPQGLMPKLVGSHTESFDHSVVLAAVYSVGGPCSDAAEAKEALGAVASVLGVASSSSGVELAQPVYEMLVNSSESELRDGLHALSEAEVSMVVGAGLAQVRVCEILSCFGLEVDMPSVVACQGRAGDQRKLLLRLLASAQRHQDERSEELSLWDSLLQLHGMSLFSRLSVDDVKQEYLRLLLSGEQFEEAQMLVDAEPHFADNAAVRQTACDVARELFDNSEMCSMDKGAMKAARLCLDLVPGEYQQDADVRRERTLIDAAHLVWTLGASVLPIFQTKKARGTDMYPIEIRLAADPYALIRRVLASYPGAYKKQRIVREIAGKLLEIAALAGAPAEGSGSPEVDLHVARRDLGVRSVSEGFTAALLLQSAVDVGDFNEGYNFARQLVNARATLSKAMRSVEAHRSARMLADDGANGSRPVDVRAIEAIWTSSVNLARAWSKDEGASSSAVDKQLEVVALALSLCPTSDIAELLRLWNAIQSRAAAVGSDSSPWTLPTESCGDPVSCVRQVLIGCPEKTREGDSASQGTLAVSPETMRTFDPAIIKRCLRLAARQPPLPSAETDPRRSLLMGWLEFALTTAKEPSSEAGLEFRRKVESDIVRRYPQAACDLLATQVLPQLDCTNYEALETFYAFYARCLEASGNTPDMEQALVRVGLIRRIKRPPVLKDLDFARLVRTMTGSKAECRAEFGAFLSEVTVMPLVDLAPDLAKLAFLPRIDGSENKEDTAGWRSDELASKLCLWVLEDILRSRSSDAGISPPVFQSILAACLPALSEPADLAALVWLVAFDSDIAECLGLECRLESTAWCYDQLAQTDSAETTHAKKLRAAQAYLGFLSDVEGLRDPFTFTKFPGQWARSFDVANGGFMLSGDDSGAEVAAQCFAVLGDMIADEVAAYFVCQAYMCTRQLVSQWDGTPEAVPGLAQVYTRTLWRVVDEAESDEMQARRVVAVAEPPLELCSFDYGDSELGEVLAQFRRDFGADISDIIHGRCSKMSEIGSSAKLALLDLLTKYCSSDLHGVASVADDISQCAALGGRAGDVCDSDYLQFRLLADKLWGLELADSGGREYADLCKVWMQLLERTEAQIAAADGQVDALVKLLVKWAGGGLDSEQAGECWATLIKWAVRNTRPARVLVALIEYPDQFTREIGDLVFDTMLEEVQGAPTMAASLAVLGLAYPDGAWAERCMEQVVYVMISDPGAEEPKEVADLPVEEEEEDPWAIDDVPLDDDDDDGHLDNTAESQNAVDTAVVAESSPIVVDPEELARARDNILSCASLHLAIMIHGYVSACLACPSLLAALAETLLRRQDRIQHDDCQALLSAPMLMRNGVEPIHELFRRTVHTVAEIGMGDTALGWVYEFLGVPVLYRYLYRKRTVAVWLEHLDQVVLGNEYAAVDAEAKSENGPSASVVEPEPELEPENGWGVSDVEFDDDDE
ncbi:hypothetical protein GGH91_000774 [Coemansia sp. RSA 2671]|nr:hypothetical protein LPJ60_001518 [Coemansia sp. RSA 2675]KAJ2349500.1 hypothetical protein GGH91_000774 [Coemansia sp. RSA 2671]